MKMVLIISAISMFAVTANAAKVTKAPEVIVTKDFGCGNYECCNLSFEWEVEKQTNVMKEPGKGKKLETLKAKDIVQPLESQNITTRGTLKLTKDKASGKAGSEYYYYNKDSSQGFPLYSKSGEEITRPSGYDFISVDMLAPECKTDACVGQIIKPSKGETYIKVKTKKNNTGWVNLSDLEPGC